MSDSAFYRRYQKYGKIISDICEGLINTTEVEQTRKILKRLGYDSFISAEHYDSGDVFGVTLKKASEILDARRLIQRCDSLGWYCANIDFAGQFLKFSEKALVKVYDSDLDYPVTLFFEAKFDRVASNISKENQIKLYHITDKRHLTKIKKIGLSPRSGEKLSSHPERIYLCNNYDDALEMKAMLLDGNYINNPILITLSLDKSKYTFRNDPNYFNQGVYTTQNIPPASIISIEQF